MVADYYLDARGSGFDLQSWTRLRDKYLAHPLPTHDAAYRCSTALHLRNSLDLSERQSCLCTHAFHLRCVCQQLFCRLEWHVTPCSVMLHGCRAIREMLAYGLKDPYTRFITPPEFEAMRKYDVTGVGLNLATAEEFTPEERHAAA